MNVKRETRRFSIPTHNNIFSRHTKSLVLVMLVAAAQRGTSVRAIINLMVASHSGVTFLLRMYFYSIPLCVALFFLLIYSNLDHLFFDSKRLQRILLLPYQKFNPLEAMMNISLL